MFTVAQSSFALRHPLKILKLLYLSGSIMNILAFSILPKWKLYNIEACLISVT